MKDGNATGSTFFATTKLQPFLPTPIRLSSLHCFSHISINYYRKALTALVQLLMLKLKMKHLLPGKDAVLLQICAACLELSVRSKLTLL